MKAFSHINIMAQYASLLTPYKALRRMKKTFTYNLHGAIRYAIDALQGISLYE